MPSLLQGPTLSASSYAEDTPSSSSFAASHSQSTPDSDDESDNESFWSQTTQPTPVTPYLPKLQSEFGRDVEEADGSSNLSCEYDQRDGSRSDLKCIRPKKGLVTSYTAAEERQVVKKFDRRLVLFLALLYLLSFLDRSNIANAKVAGLADDLKLSSSQYEWLLTAFYITYILFEWMTLMYRLVPPHIFIPICVCAWGLVASFQCLVTSFWVLVALRALLGIAEAAFGPGVPFYLSLFYKREELAFRTGLFISAAPLASSFASSLAWLIVKLSSNGPIAPWRTLFLVEGFPSVIVAVFAWMIIPDAPGRARFLTPRERKVAKLRLEERKADLHESRSARFNWNEVGQTLSDPKSYLTALMFFSCNVAFSSMPVFLPTIIKDMGYSSLASQALSAPPYLLAFVVVLITASLSDRHRTRSPYLIAHAVVSSAAYLAIAATGYFHSYMPSSVHTFIRYICIYPATCGFFSAITIIITWAMDNRAAKEGKGTGVAILNIIGQCGPLVGTRLYPASDGPWYVHGMAVCSFFMMAVAVMALVLRLLLQRENQKSERIDEELEMVEGEGEGLMSADAGGGGKHAAERFTYIV